MNPPANLVPTDVASDAVELRIHGVSGTPPEALLRDFPVLVDGDSRSGFYRREATSRAGVVEAYCWGGMTSASRMTALWLFLLPYSLLNVAGWSGSKSGEARQRGHAIAVRLLGLTLTAVVIATLMLAAGNVLIGPVPGLQAPDWLKPFLSELRDLPSTPVLAATGMAVPVVPWLLARSTRKRYEEDALDGIDELTLASSAKTTDIADLWNQPNLHRSMSNVHLLAGVSLVTLFIGLLDGTPNALLWIAGAGLLASVICLAWGSTDGSSRTVEWSGLLATFLASAILALTGYLAMGAGDGLVSDMEAAAETVIVGGLTLAVPLIVSMVVCERGFVGPAFSIWSLASGASAASGLAYFTRPGNPSPAVELLSVTLVSAASWFVLLPLLWIWRSPNASAADDDEWAAWQLRRTVAAAPWWLAIGAAAMAIAAVFLLPLSYNGSLLTFLGSDLWEVTVRAVATFGIAGLLGAALRTNPVVRLLVPLTAAFPLLDVLKAEWVVSFSVLVATAAPVAAALFFVLRASSDHEIRRRVGVLWDLITYWPRWYHPWAPPPYPEQAVPAIAARIRRLGAQPEVAKVVVSAHSQGAVLAMPVLHRLSPEELSPVRLVTYGNLLDKHYGRIFPDVFGTDALTAVDDLLGGDATRRWINLYRNTDPLGHTIDSLGGRSRSADGRVGEALLTHSDYQYSPEYQVALDELVADQ